MEAVSIVLIVFFIILMAMPLWHGRFWLVDRANFPKIHIPRAAFLFSGVGYPEAKEDGVIAPVFVLSVLNYAFALVSAIFVAVLALAMQVAAFDLMFITLYMLVANLIINFGTAAVCAIITIRKSKSEN
ncbi:MAG: hypothetical protein K2K80_06580 [Clostridia bacterium]|nr:hypothetical protein [Clostridia bacterium]